MQGQVVVGPTGYFGHSSSSHKPARPAAPLGHPPGSRSSAVATKKSKVNTSTHTVNGIPRKGLQNSMQRSHGLGHDKNGGSRGRYKAIDAGLCVVLAGCPEKVPPWACCHEKNEYQVGKVKVTVDGGALKAGLHNCANDLSGKLCLGGDHHENYENFGYVGSKRAQDYGPYLMYEGNPYNCDAPVECRDQYLQRQKYNRMTKGYEANYYLRHLQRAIHKSHGDTGHHCGVEDCRCKLQGNPNYKRPSTSLWTDIVSSDHNERRREGSEALAKHSSLSSSSVPVAQRLSQSSSDKNTKLLNRSHSSSDSGPQENPDALLEGLLLRSGGANKINMKTLRHILCTTGPTPLTVHEFDQICHLRNLNPGRDSEDVELDDFVAWICKGGKAAPAVKGGSFSSSVSRLSVAPVPNFTQVSGSFKRFSSSKSSSVSLKKKSSSVSLKKSSSSISGLDNADELIHSLAPWGAVLTVKQLRNLLCNYGPSPISAAEFDAVCRLKGDVDPSNDHQTVDTEEFVRFCCAGKRRASPRGKVVKQLSQTLLMSRSASGLQILGKRSGTSSASASAKIRFTSSKSSSRIKHPHVRKIKKKVDKLVHRNSNSSSSSSSSTSKSSPSPSRKVKAVNVSRSLSSLTPVSSPSSPSSPSKRRKKGLFGLRAKRNSNSNSSSSSTSSPPTSLPVTRSTSIPKIASVSSSSKRRRLLKRKKTDKSLASSSSSSSSKRRRLLKRNKKTDKSLSSRSSKTRKNILVRSSRSSRSSSSPSLSRPSRSLGRSSKSSSKKLLFNSGKTRSKTSSMSSGFAPKRGGCGGNKADKAVKKQAKKDLKQKKKAEKKAAKEAKKLEKQRKKAEKEAAKEAKKAAKKKKKALNSSSSSSSSSRPAAIIKNRSVDDSTSSSFDPAFHAKLIADVRLSQEAARSLASKNSSTTMTSSSSSSPFSSSDIIAAPTASAKTKTKAKAKNKAKSKAGAKAKPKAKAKTTNVNSSSTSSSSSSSSSSELFMKGRKVISSYSSSKAGNPFV